MSWPEQIEKYKQMLNMTLNKCSWVSQVQCDTGAPANLLPYRGIWRGVVFLLVSDLLPPGDCNSILISTFDNVKCERWLHIHGKAFTEMCKTREASVCVCALQSPRTYMNFKACESEHLIQTTFFPLYLLE